MMPAHPPRLVRRFGCPSCHAVVALEYKPRFDGHLVPTLFECPACEHACSLDLPGELLNISRDVAESQDTP